MIRTSLVGILLSLTSMPFPAEADDANDIIGTWRIVQFHDDGGDKSNRLGVVLAQGKRPAKVAHLVVTKDEIYIVRADGMRDATPGLTNCAWLSCRLHERVEPKQIDLVSVPGKDGKSKTYYGIYSLAKDQLSICWNETPRSTDPAKIRPVKFESDGEMNLLVCDRVSREIPNKEAAAEARPQESRE